MGGGEREEGEEGLTSPISFASILPVMRGGRRGTSLMEPFSSTVALSSMGSFSSMAEASDGLRSTVAMVERLRPSGAAGACGGEGVEGRREPRRNDKLGGELISGSAGGAGGGARSYRVRACGLVEPRHDGKVTLIVPGTRWPALVWRG